MSKVKIVGNAAVITSDLKIEEIERVKKYTKNGLKLKDEKGNEIFFIDTTKNGVSSITNHGVVFAEQSAEGYAQATLLIAEDVKAEDRLDVILDNFAIALGNLKALETYIRSAAIEVNETIEGIKEQIEVID